MNTRTRAPRVRLTAAVALAATMTGLAASAPAVADDGTRAPSSQRAATTGIPEPGEGSAPASSDTAGAREATRKPLTQRQLRRAVERTLREAGYVNVSVDVRDGTRHTTARAGEAKLNTGRPVPAGASFRGGSTTKSFVAVVVLQLVAEGELSLDDTVHDWLPGLITGNGNDGRRITIRHLLQHTSGLYNYDRTEDTGNTAADFERTRLEHLEPEQLIAGALRHKPDFDPADPDDPTPGWNYSNPGYVLLGMIIEKATGRPWGEEVRQRIVKPLGLRGTYAPGDDPYLRGPHAHIYQQFPGSRRLTDTTVRNMSWGDAAGALVTTERDLDRFYTALLTGDLLPAEQLGEMREVVPVSADFDQVMPGLRYGLGLMRQPLACGGDRWGHGGDVEGGTVRTGFTADGKRGVVIAASGKASNEAWLMKAERSLQSLLDQTLCGTER
ncbi:beta-lactamase family protein [Streptomyces sp. AC563]|uniref:serine hydrolase domain-containing protein n=1 Tax=Streptomyces buecherae TaxID=2763006 RepID=UPI00164E7DF5|nr:serine hydrolase domain-containing protein [Streptomyces buecherae]MBC3991408.1 beta-lactamase family protein [Streptomyces buecherae]